jgi:hypothetical protein
LSRQVRIVGEVSQVINSHEGLEASLKQWRDDHLRADIQRPSYSPALTGLHTPTPEDTQVERHHREPGSGVKTSLWDEAEPPGVGPPEMT